MTPYACTCSQLDKGPGTGFAFCHWKNQRSCQFSRRVIYFSLKMGCRGSKSGDGTPHRLTVKLSVIQGMLKVQITHPGPPLPLNPSQVFPEWRPPWLKMNLLKGWNSITVLFTRSHQCERLVQKRPSMCYYVCVIMYVKDP